MKTTNCLSYKIDLIFKANLNKFLWIKQVKPNKLEKDQTRNHANACFNRLISKISTHLNTC